jgi:hypothetical protein
MKIPKDLESITDQDWQELFTQEKEAKNFQESLEYFFWRIKEYFTDFWYSSKNGIRNYWTWRKIIWKDRWWDYSFFHNLLKFKLQNLYNNWDKVMLVIQKTSKLKLKF